MTDYTVYIIAIVLLIAAIVIVKKITSCMFRIALAVIVAAILGVLYYLYC